mgnify:CR=1 FL=1
MFETRYCIEKFQDMPPLLTSSINSFKSICCNINLMYNIRLIKLRHIHSTINMDSFAGNVSGRG